MKKYFKRKGLFVFCKDPVDIFVICLGKGGFIFRNVVALVQEQEVR